MCNFLRIRHGFRINSVPRRIYTPFFSEGDKEVIPKALDKYHDKDGQSAKFAE